MLDSSCPPSQRRVELSPAISTLLTRHPAPRPANEPARLRALAAYGLASTALEEEFDHFAAIAADLLQVPIGLVTLVGDEHVTIKGRRDITTTSFPRDIAFCSHVILGDTVLAIPDLSQDDRFAGNPFVTAEGGLRFYAGAPLISPIDGHRIGALCVADRQARTVPDARELRLLANVAALVVKRMDLRRSEKARHDAQAQFERMADAAPGAVVCASADGCITQWNTAAERLFGWPAIEAVGQTLQLIVPDHLRAAHAAGFARLAASGDRAFPGRTVELPALRRDGTTFPAQITLSSWYDGDSPVFGASIYDITARRAAEDRLRYLAHHDPLTGLANRARLAELIAEASAGDGALALALLNLDGFKHVNDTLGHGAGDVLLTEVGQRLAGALQGRGVLARLGGDEFAVLLSDCDDTGAASACAGSLQASLEPVFHIGGRSVQVGASTGVAVAPAAEARSLLANADLALYQAKATGRGAGRAFNVAMRDAYDARRALEAEVHTAVTAGQLTLHYQPQVRMDTGALIGAEALLRWHHPQRGLLPPGAFLEALEAGPLAGQVGNWAIDEACRQAAAWREQGLPLRVSVNLFAEQLRAGTLASTVRRSLTKWRLPPAALELEVTETIALQHDEGLLAPLHALHAEGVSIAFDDFGTGFASLSTLKRCPLDRLKIDRGFVSDLGTKGELGGHADRSNVAIIDAVLALGHALGLKVVAEGVETPAQAAFLASRGCDEGQGYLFGRPGPATALCGDPTLLAAATLQSASSAQSLAASVAAWARAQLDTAPLRRLRRHNRH